MTAAVTAAVVVLLLALGGAVGYLLSVHRARRLTIGMTTYAEAEKQYNEYQRLMLARLLNKTRGDAEVRYEIELADFGPEQPADMRWRWVAWDADRYLTVTLDPEADSIGREIPAMLGNAATKMLALRDAAMWVIEQGSSVVVLPSPLVKDDVVPAPEPEPEHVYEIRYTFDDEGPVMVTLDGVPVDEDNPHAIKITTELIGTAAVWVDGQQVKAKVYRNDVLSIDTSVDLSRAL